MFNRDTIAAFLEWVQRAGPWGALLFGLAYIPAAVLFTPASLLTLVAGFIFGVLKGTVIASLGSTAGATAAFITARTVARRWIADRTASWAALGAVIRAVETDAFKIVLLTRLTPLFPFSLLNYAFGVSTVTLRTFVLASWIGMLPGTIMYIYLGSAARSLTALLSGELRRTPAQQTLFAVGLVATLVVTTLVTRTARRALRPIVNSPS